MKCLDQNCREPPPYSTGDNNTGTMDWIEVPGITGQFATLVRYSCINSSWGYPSTGLNETWAMCSDYGDWNITQVENCTGTEKSNYRLIINNKLYYCDRAKMSNATS